MTDLILGHDWPRPVHQLAAWPAEPAAAERRTVMGRLAHHAHEIPGAPFIGEVGNRAPPVTYGQAYRTVQQRAALLRASGLRPGDRVAVVGHTSVDFVLNVLAILEAGGVTVLLSPFDPARRLTRHVDFVHARFLLFDEASAAGAGSCGGADNSWAFEEFASSPPRGSDITGPPPAPTDAALIVFTSGTTGAPKAVVLSHHAVALNARTLAAHHQIRAGTRLLCVLPLHHVNGLGFTVLAVMFGGGHTTLSRGFDGLRFWPTVREHDIHIVSLVPNLLRLLASRPPPRAARPVNLRYAVSAAAPLSTQIAQQTHERLGLRIVQGYGLSEVTNFSCLMPLGLSDDQYERWMLAGRRTSVGPALPGQRVEVQNDSGLAGLGEEGEIVIRGPCIMSGYLHDEAATQEAFRGGWFHTGDLGYWLPGEAGAKYIHVSGRTREIAKRAGALVSLLELDEVLTSIPGVADAGAAAFANTWVDEELGAVVVPRSGCAVTEDEVLAECRRVLPFSAVPKRVEFVEEVPRTATGKIRRQELADRFAEYRERLFVETPPAANASAGTLRQVEANEGETSWEGEIS